VRPFTRGRAWPVLLACLAFGAWAPSAAAATRVFRPRVGHALGLIPPVNSQGNFNTQPTENGVLTPVVYHGGAVMNQGVTVHTIFWAPSGYAFQGSPGPGVPTYEGMIEQFFTDVAAASGNQGECSASACNMFSTLTQFADGTSVGSVAPGKYAINYSTSDPNDVIIDTDPYPSGQCSSPQGAKACISDGQLQQEIDAIAKAHGNARGLTNLWYVFLPPDVDECISQDVCGTNAFGGYHSLSNINGDGLTIYALTIDPIIESGSISPGADPEGNPDAEVTVDIAAHETNEAMTDPEGVGWMDPNGFEVGDKCEFGPQRGTPLGFGPDGSPYNQVINGHEYLTQEIWSNDGDAGNPVPSCVQGTSLTSNPLPLPQVNLTQFSPSVSGNIGSKTANVSVKVTLLRGAGATQVAQQATTTDANGNWSLTLQHAVGDDRDEIDVDYSGTGAPTPNHQVILTGNGGNPFTESGWTGWTDVDNGIALTNGPPPSLTIAPCFQTGVESFTFDGAPQPTSPTDFCGTSSDAATVVVSHIGAGDSLTVTTNDNRAFQPADAQTPNPTGGLVSMTVPAGEPDAVSLFVNPLPGFTPTGFPTCTADLGVQLATCTGLVPGEAYTLTDGGQHRSATADATGTATAPLRLRGGDTVTLSNGSRTVTTLHVAHLRVSLAGDFPATVSRGSCEPDQYWGGPLTTAPTNAAAGEPSDPTGGAALTGLICPANGDASGLPAGSIVQTDERSGGTTQTEVAGLLDTSPIEGETMYGAFTALAEASDGSSPIALTIRRSSRRKAVFRASNVDTRHGVRVKGLKPGTYTATWVVRDSNGDTRTVVTRFIESSVLQAARGSKAKVTCTRVAHHKVMCTLSFIQSSSRKGTMMLSLTRGTEVGALGHGRLSQGSATITMRELGTAPRGRWTLTIVLSESHRQARTIPVSVNLG
jgi:hypothetical protein